MKYRKKTLEADFKGAVVDYRMAALLWNKKNSREVGSELNICKEFLFPVHGVFLVKKNFYGLQKMNEKIEQLQSSGIIQHFIDGRLNFKSSKYQKPGPTALTIMQLAGVFQIMAFGYFSAFVVVLVENIRFLKLRNVKHF